jgi:protein-L-isoaspartate O-methyltransferase
VGKVLSYVAGKLPYPVLTTLQVAKILSQEYGHFRSAKTWSCVDKEGKPIPWYTYPALEYIKQFDLRDKSVFEFGSGNSTLFWADRVREVVSVEDDPKWYEKTRVRLNGNATLTLALDETSYVQHIGMQGKRFDIIVVDGSYRSRCAAEAVEWLEAGGMIILDNADWYVEAARRLRMADLIEVDMTGFGPINSYTFTTSFFLHRAFNFLPRHVHQPVHGIGSLKQYAQE